MTVRHFRDGAGVDWQVYFTERRENSGRRDQYLPESFRSGWLVFESATEKRRMAPVPPDWAALSDEALMALCASASPSPPRSAPSGDRGASGGERDAGRAARTGASVPADAGPARTGGKDPLRPELNAAEDKLDRTLEEVCESPTAKALDTGELIRIEETLAIATQAAKEAVSLRRKLHANKERDEQQSDASGSDSR